MADMEHAESNPTLEQRVDALAATVRDGFAAVDVALVEQRQYTELAFEQLGLRFGKLEGRFDKLEGRFDKLEGRFDKLEGRFDKLEGRFDKLEGRFGKLEGRFGRVERKFDQFIDTQSRTNELVERRLAGLENPATKGDRT